MPTITFLPDGNRIEVPSGTSILEAAKKCHAQVGYACGGVCACSTCHVKIKQGLDCFPEPSEDELDQLDEARGVGLDSRLGCQERLLRVPAGGVVTIEIPSWNVNLVQEGH